MAGMQVRMTMLLTAALGLGACAQVVPVAEGVAQLPRKAVEGTAGFFEYIFSSPELAVQVAEVSRLQQCGTSGRESTLEVLAGPNAILGWESARGVKLTADSGSLPTGLYAVAEMGERNTGGYALLISREAATKDRVLYLKASFMSPSVSGMATQVLTSPCTLVSLPASEDFRTAVLVDQNGRERARWSPTN